MIHVDFDPERLTGEDRAWFDDWSERARIASEGIIERWRREGRATFSASDQKLWAELKRWLLKNVFANKCAYCEKKFVKESTDAEHYRPKGGVQHAGPDRSEPIRVVGPDGVARDHPGYFWL